MSRLFIIAVLFAALVPFAAAQSGASLNGSSATDPQGASVAGAIVDVTNLSTSVKRSVVSDESGLYSFPQLAPGAYKIAVQAPGFAVSTVDHVELLVNARNRFDRACGRRRHTISFSDSGGGREVNTVDASLGNAIGTEPIVELPLEARIQRACRAFKQESPTSGSHPSMVVPPIPLIDWEVP